MIELKSDYKYALVIPTSIGTRLTPVDGQPFHCSDTFKLQTTSAESNVSSVASYLGLRVKILTAFVKGSPASRLIKDNLASRHMDYEGPEYDQGGPSGATVTRSIWRTVVPASAGDRTVHLHENGRITDYNHTVKVPS